MRTILPDGIYKLFIVLFTAMALGACTDTSFDATQNTTATVSGKVILAHDGSGLGNALVQIRIGGMVYEVRTTGGDSIRTGDFKFTNLPINAAYSIYVKPAESDLFAPGQTGTTDITDSGEDIDGVGDEFNSRIASVDVGLLHVFKKMDSTITIMDVETGTPISGLGLFIPYDDVGAPNPMSIALEVTQFEETNGVYTIGMPDTGFSYVVQVNSLKTADGVQYQTLAGDQLSVGTFDNGTGVPDNATDDDSPGVGQFTLTQLSAGQNITLYLRRTSPYTLTVNFDLFDVDGNPYTGAGMAIGVVETANGDDLTAARDATQMNRYSLTTSYRNTLSYQVQNLDLNGDSFPDTQATAVFSAANVNANGETAVTIPVTITEMNATTDVLADVLSTSIVPGIDAEAVIAFNQPVETVGDVPVLVRVNALNMTAASDNTDTVAPLATVLNSLDAAGGIALNPNPSGTNAAQYEYTDNLANPNRIFTLQGADAATGDIVDPFETRVDADESIVAATLTPVNASNTIFTLDMDASSITDLQQVEFTVLVKASGSDVSQVVSGTLFAQTTASGTLSDLMVDDGDFIDNSSVNVLTSASTLINAENPAREYTLPDTSGLGACGATNCKFRALAQPVAAAIGANEGVLSIVSPTAFYGTVKLVNYTVTSDVAGVATDTTTDIFDTQITVSSTADEAAMLSDATNTDDADLADTRGNYEYFLNDPENQDLDDKNGDSLGAAYGVGAAVAAGRVDFNGWTRGYAYPEGIGYRVDITGLGIPAVAVGEVLKSVTLDLDVVMAGQRQTGQVTFNVE